MILNAMYLTNRYNHELQTQGWTAVNLATNNGSLEKPSLCEYCRVKPPRDFHHTDYNSPLVGKWACRSCHRKEHERIKRLLHLGKI